MSFPAYFPARVRLEEGFHSTPHQVVVVCNQNAEISHGSLLKLGLGARLMNSAKEDIRRNQLYWKPIIHNKWESRRCSFHAKVGRPTSPQRRGPRESMATFGKASTMDKSKSV